MRARGVGALALLSMLAMLDTGPVALTASAEPAVEELRSRIGDANQAPIQAQPGSSLQRYDPAEPADYRLIVGIDPETAEFKGERLAGRVSHYHYANPEDRSTGEIFEGYRAALEQSGMMVVFACAGDACGPTYSSSRWQLYNGMAAYDGSETGYLAATMEVEGSRSYVALMVGAQRTQVDVIEIEASAPAVADVVAADGLDADSLAGSIAADGRVRVDGILFDSNRATLRPESRTAIAEIARLLRRQEELRLYVVGHTDDVGAIGHNMRLSHERARAVIGELVRRHGVDETRLSAYGVGPLAPAAPNTSDDGRSRNRRVELVAR